MSNFRFDRDAKTDVTGHRVPELRRNSFGALNLHRSTGREYRFALGPARVPGPD
jgi:hypothetical protein